MCRHASVVGEEKIYQNKVRETKYFSGHGVWVKNENFIFIKHNHKQEKIIFTMTEKCPPLSTRD